MAKVYSEDFLTVYKAFPKVRTTGRVAPYRSWNSLKAKEELPDTATLLRAIELQKTSEKWLAGYCPMFQTWLNQHGWEAGAEINLAIEAKKDAQQRKKASFIESQQAVQQDVLDVRDKRKSRLQYNVSKFLALNGVTRDEPSVYLSQLVVYNEIDLRCKVGRTPLSDACLISDAFIDVLSAKFKGGTPSDEEFTSFWEAHKATIVVLLFTRHAHGSHIDILHTLVELTEADCLSMRKVITYLSTPSKVVPMRKAYNIKTFVMPTDWFCMYPSEVVLQQFPEVH